MAGVLEGLRVLDLSWGGAGPMATMLLSDHGADVTRIERPGGEPFGDVLDGYRIWQRGKRSAILDLKSPADRDAFLALAAQADVLVESFAPGVTDRLGISFARLSALNPRLIYCSITAYGRGTKDEGRPGYDALVTARTGLQWEARGWDGGPINRVLGRDKSPDDFAPVPESIRIGSDRLGPIFTATPALSVATAYLATIGISAALRVREVTGLGQLVETSMAQAAIQYAGTLWQRPDHPDVPGYETATVDRRQTWGMVEAADRWMCFWVGSPVWAEAAGRGDVLKVPDVPPFASRVPGGPGKAERRSLMPTLDDRLESLAAVAPIFAKFRAADWARVAAEAGAPLQPVRTPEEALTDPSLLADGSATVVNDPEHGPMHQAGILFRLHDRPTRVRGVAAKRGEHTDAVRAEAARAPKPAPATIKPKATLARGPLDGIRVIDIGLAVAGPWSTQLMADMGAEVIKIDPAGQAFWIPTHMGVAVNRSKRSLQLDIKHPDGLATARELIGRADVIMNNMRPGAADRLGLDYATCAKINPRLVYCQTRGFEDGPRSQLPGHDQGANALGGTEWEDGGCWNGGRPFFGILSGGDLGNGFFAATAMILALYDREKTGKGQFVDTSILNAALFNNSRVWTTPDGRHIDRPAIDADQRGYSALYRLYDCASGWLCLAVLSDAHWDALTRAVKGLAEDKRFATAADRKANDKALVEVLGAAFRERSAGDWSKALDAAGVPNEVSNATFSQTVFDDPDYIARHWVTKCKDHPTLGDIDMFGIGIDFSLTPSRPGGPPPMLGQHSNAILRDWGFDEARIDSLCESGAAAQATVPVRK